MIHCGKKIFAKILFSLNSHQYFLSCFRMNEDLFTQPGVIAEVNEEGGYGFIKHGRTFVLFSISDVEQGNPEIGSDVEYVPNEGLVNKLFSVAKMFATKIEFARIYFSESIKFKYFVLTLSRIYTHFPQVI